MIRNFSFGNGVQVVEEMGAGLPVMLVHGFGEDREIWREQAKKLATSYRVILPDLPGSGGSELIPDLSMEGMAACLNAGLDEAGIDRVVMVGHSMGGYIALAFAELFPDRLRGFGLFHSTAYADTEAKKETRQKGIGFIREHGAGAFLKTVIPNLFSPAFREGNQAVVRELIDRGNNFSAAALVLYYESMMARPERTHILKQTNLPVLFVIGAHDGAVLPEDSLRQTHLPAISYFHWLSGSGHMGMLEEPVATHQLLAGFLRDLAANQD
jgi:pimeloyl-ACP methyl ester carboxylesterase